MSVTGTLRKVTLDGVTFRAKGDINIKATPSAYENGVVPTSGGNIRKKSKRAETVESVTLYADGAERDQLKGFAEGSEDIPMSYETAAGDVYRAEGWIEFESWESEEGTATIKMIPRDTWEAFLA